MSAVCAGWLLDLGLLVYLSAVFVNGLTYLHLFPLERERERESEREGGGGGRGGGGPVWKKETQES